MGKIFHALLHRRISAKEAGVLCYIAQTILHSHRGMMQQQKLDAEAAARKAAEEEKAMRPSEPFVDLPRPIREGRPAPQPTATDKSASQESNVSNHQAASSSSSSSSSSTPVTSAPRGEASPKILSPAWGNPAPAASPSSTSLAFSTSLISTSSAAALDRALSSLVRRRWRSGRPWWSGP